MNPRFLELTVAELRKRYWDQVTVARATRDGKPLSLRGNEYLQKGDIVEMVGPRKFFLGDAADIGEEIPLGYRLTDASEAAQVIVMNEKVRGKTVSELHVATRFGLVLSRISRLGTNLPVEPQLRVEKGDILTVHGPAKQLDALGRYLGAIERDISETDMVTFAFGIAAGIVIGLLSIEVFGVSIGLGSAGGLLLSGLLIGYFRNMRPTFGRLPDAARWFLMEFGLLLFMTGVGLRAGGGIIETFKQAGPLLIVGGHAGDGNPDTVGLPVRAKGAENRARPALRRHYRIDDQWGCPRRGYRRGEEFDTGAGIYRNVCLCQCPADDCRQRDTSLLRPNELLPPRYEMTS